MTLNEYQKQAGNTDLGAEDWYYALGLAGEAGEVVELIKKKHRKLNMKMTVNEALLKSNLLGELGDNLWYNSRLASKYDLALEDIAQFNLTKLGQRKAEGYLVG